MAYRFTPEETVRENLRRLVDEQLACAQAELEDGGLDPHDAIHAVRKRGKKLRALLRLARAALGPAFRAEDRALRDAGRALSDLRDAHSRVEACDALAVDFPAPADQAVLGAVRARLVARRDERDATAPALVGGRARALTAFSEVRARAPLWELEASGFRALAAGLEDTYRRAARTQRDALASAEAERFHEWRKHAKAHAHHLRLLTGAWPELLGPAEVAATTLAQRLGDDHDLALLEELLGEEPGVLGPPQDVEALRARLGQRRAALRREARALGARVFAEEPAAFTARVRGYWRAWRRETRGFRGPRGGA
jgi:CHAD domain-containing protein